MSAASLDHRHPSGPGGLPVEIGMHGPGRGVDCRLVVFLFTPKPSLHQQARISHRCQNVPHNLGFRTGPRAQAWGRELSGDRVAVLLFNRADTARAMSVDFAALGLGKGTKMAVRDVVLKKDLGATTGSVGGRVGPHAVLFVVLSLPTGSVRPPPGTA